MAITRTTETFGLDVGSSSLQPTQAPGAVFEDPVPQKQNWTKGLDEIVGPILDRSNRDWQAKAKLQGAKDEFEGVANAEKNSNWFTRGSYEEGVAQQRAAQAYSDFQAEATKDFEKARERGEDPAQFVEGQKQRLIDTLNTKAGAMSSEDWAKSLNMALPTLSAVGHAYTEYKLRADKNDQVTATNQVLATASRNLLLERANLAQPDPVPMGAGVQAGIAEINASRRSLNGAEVDKAVVTYVENAAKTAVTNGVAGIVRVNQMYNDALKNPGLGGMSAEQQQQVLNALEKVRDDSAQQYVAESLTHLDTMHTDALVRGVPAPVGAVRQQAADVDQLWRAGFITSAQRHQVVAKANDLLVAEAKRVGDARAAGMVISPEGATKALREEEAHWRAVGESPKSAALIAASNIGTRAVTENNLYLMDAAGKVFGDTVKNWQNMVTPEGKPDAADVGFMSLLREAYRDRNDPQGTSRWSMYTQNLRGGSNEALVLEQVLNNSQGATDEQLLKAYVEQMRAGKVLETNGGGSLQAALDELDPRGFVEGTVDALRTPFAAVGRVLSGGVASSVEEDVMQLGVVTGPMQRQYAAMVADKYSGPEAGRLLARDAERTMKRRSMSAPGVKYSVFFGPGVEEVSRELINEADGSLSDKAKGITEKLIQDWRKANPNAGEFLAVEAKLAGDAVILQGTFRKSAGVAEGQVRIGVFDSASFRRFVQKDYEQVKQAREARSMVRKVPVHGGQAVLDLGGGNNVGWSGQAFLSAQALALELKPPGMLNPAVTTPVTEGLVQRALESTAPAVKAAFETLGHDPATMDPQVRDTYTALFAGVAAGGKGGKADLEHMVQEIKRVRETPDTVDDVALEKDLRSRFPRVSDEVWQTKFLPLLTGVITNTAAMLP